ncbi:heme-binding protein [Stieleria sp. TO1_6]|uniref:multiheme c-type cytochrome n=1 Tax=Stieleria tagensis TaxID=2956795 RepID=UPI00209AB1B7|nr:multiheme c-type cytochrome [Stieleria tagensis]MCO8120324.1 heme-binding protein [Stieleria tagensis]
MTLRFTLSIGAMVLVGGVIFFYFCMEHEFPSTSGAATAREIRPAASTRLNADALPPSVAARVSAWEKMIAANFAGDDACVQCHPSESQAHQRSGHSHTAIKMADSALAKQLIELGTYADPLRSQTFQFEMNEGQFTVQDVSPGAQSIKVPVTWLLGSGTHAQTPVTVDLQTQRGIELRWSFLAGQNGLGVTPDQTRYQQFRNRSVECFGRPMDSADIRSCIGCHATVSAPPELPFLDALVVENVGCERCHGPRKKHVDLAHRGQAELAKPLISLDDPDVYMNICSGCHRDESSVAADALPHELARFQPYGLKRSACYLKSGQSMTCSTCHDPHDTVSHDRAFYVSKCQSCHSETTQRSCPQPLRGDCIECHMPKTQWTAGIAFHDHWIRLPDDDSRSPKKTASDAVDR